MWGVSTRRLGLLKTRRALGKLEEVLNGRELAYTKTTTRPFIKRFIHKQTNKQTMRIFILVAHAFVAVVTTTLAAEWTCLTPETTGTFVCSSNCNLTDTVLLTGSLSVEGPSSLVTIRANATKRHFTVQTAHTLTLKWLILTGSDIRAESGDSGKGGAVFLGGATGTSLVAVLCLFILNKAVEGGSIYTSYGALTLTDTNITDSYASGVSGGGAVRAVNTPITMSGGHILRNEAIDYCCGAFSITRGVHHSFTHSHFKDNKGPGASSISTIRFAGGGKIDMNHVVIESNSGSSYAVYLDLGSNCSMNNTVVARNSGGGISIRGNTQYNWDDYYGGVSQNTHSYLDIQYSVIRENTAGAGAGLHFQDASVVTIRDSSFILNQATNQRGHQILSEAHLYAGSYGAVPTIYAINTNFTSAFVSGNFWGKEVDDSGWIGGPYGASSVYVGTKNCSTSPCNNGPCIDLQSNHGVLCGWSGTCSAGNTLHLPPSPNFDCQAMSSCKQGEFISMNGTSYRDRSCSPWTQCAPGQFVSKIGTFYHDQVCTVTAAPTTTAPTSAPPNPEYTTPATDESTSLAQGTPSYPNSVLLSLVLFCCFLLQVS